MKPFFAIVLGLTVFSQPSHARVSESVRLRELGAQMKGTYKLAPTSPSKFLISTSSPGAVLTITPEARGDLKIVDAAGERTWVFYTRAHRGLLLRYEDGDLELPVEVSRPIGNTYRYLLFPTRLSGVFDSPPSDSSPSGNSPSESEAIREEKKRLEESLEKLGKGKPDLGRSFETITFDKDAKKITVVRTHLNEDRDVIKTDTWIWTN